MCVCLSTNLLVVFIRTKPVILFRITRNSHSSLPKAYYFQTKNTEPPVNYNGAKRSYCPATAYEQPPNRQNTSLRLKQLRTEMVRLLSVQGPPLDGYIVTSDDAHQSNSLDPHDMRREFISGFYGSYGQAVITLDKAVFWTDGRYHIQADNQLDCNWILMKQGAEDVPSITEWLVYEFQNRTDSVRIGADPTLVSGIVWGTWKDELELAGSTITLVPVSNNLVDLIWQVGRPNYNTFPAYPLSDNYSGRSWQDKIKSVRDEMKITNADALVLTALDEIAWLFNIRGYDLPNTPVLRAYAIITHTSIDLFAPEHKIQRSVEEHLKMDLCSNANCVKKHNYTSIWNELRTMSQAWNLVWLPTQCSYSAGASKEIFNSVPAKKQLAQPSPVLFLRAEKNKVEAEGMRRSHLRDGAAMCDFLSYLEMEWDAGLDEMKVARLANEFRYEQDHNKGISFPTIVGYGPHAAIPHYEPNDQTSIAIGQASTVVVDSGGQYLDGTTDVTRTLHFGTPTEEQRRAYTLVLIGAIELSSFIFPSTLNTNQLDVIARSPLWNISYDYLHGTGHGIGHFLSVHESPISVSYMQAERVCGSIEFKPGYFLSNEPGYYKEGEFGVRLENILETVEANTSHEDSITFLKFRDVTLVPYEPKLIDIKMLNPSHIRWLNNYNRRIRDEVGPELIRRLRMDAYNWMLRKTKPISVDDASTLEQCHILLFLAFTCHTLFGFSGTWS
ncbi:unnamed protein product [Xylocopa violacea]|uniref:Xaa-Pro aminopeptidase 1 n=1 Tax=Xylocopa violacea TaxID=135666 RepID=A0ABP1N2Z5_XYLVO